jgi:hypothetical protein
VRLREDLGVKLILGRLATKRFFARGTEGRRRVAHLRDSASGVSFYPRLQLSKRRASAVKPRMQDRYGMVATAGSE